MSEPRTEMTLTQAVDSLNHFDLQAIKKNFNVTLSQAEERGEDLAYALVWILEKRRDADVKPKDIQAWPMGQINGYFVPEDDADPLETN